MSALISKEEVRRRITTDHAVLRSLCRALVSVARASETDESQLPVLKDVLRQLTSELERHFDFEEHIVVPLLKGDDAWGPVRVELLHRDHAEQRAILRAVMTGVDSGVREITGPLVRFFQRFEQDMDDEEARLLTAESLGAEPMVDQVDG